LIVIWFRRHGTPVPDSFSVSAEEASVYQKLSAISTRRFLRGMPSWPKRHLIDPASVSYEGSARGLWDTELVLSWGSKKKRFAMRIYGVDVARLKSCLVAINLAVTGST
jgi:hypothetical protein